MAKVIEWRREPQSDPHTGSVEVNNGTGKPILYAHPEDGAGANYSPAAAWAYSQSDASDLHVAGHALTVLVGGLVSYSTYAALFTRWWAAGWIRRSLARIAAVFLGQESPARVFGRPLATDLQPSGDLRYEAWLSLDPPEPHDTILDIRVDMTGTALTLALPGSAGKNGTTANAIAFDQNGEVDNIRVRGMFGAPPATDAKTVTYAVTVPAGGEVKVASAATGPAFFISAGTAVFTGTTGVVITV